MREAVLPLAKRAGVTLREVDIDSDPVLEARWGELVPVLLADERELCHHRLDRDAVTACLAGAPR